MRLYKSWVVNSFPLKIFLITKEFFLFYCFSHFEDIHLIKKCYFKKIVINKYQYINTTTFRATETSKPCEACSIVHWEGTCRRP